jgi:hypothetical protein
MKVAIILTGALRTITKTIPYFKKNLLLQPTDIYICVQNDTQESEETWNAWFKEELGKEQFKREELGKEELGKEHGKEKCNLEGVTIKTITWFSLYNYKDWVGHRELLLQNMRIDSSWKNYLRSSGSMIEYFQLQLAYMKMTEYEHYNKFEYDYLIRARTDSIYTKPIDFHWLRWTPSDVAERVEVIKEELRLSKIPEEQLFPYFMSTIVSDDVIPNIQYIHAGYYPYQGFSLHDLHTYIKEGRYILTFRKNNLYIVRRSLFHLIPSLGTMYGQFKSPFSDQWWFNAEGQFTSVCYHAMLNTHDYNTDFEDRSVEAVGWNEATFFDCEFNCINPRMLYCMVRK